LFCPPARELVVWQETVFWRTPLRCPFRCHLFLRAPPMPRLPSSPVALLVLALLAPVASAQEPIRFARTPDISPDGKLIAFSYLADIYTVESTGGAARAVTPPPSHDITPAFSPDGRHLAFSSNRHGS